MTFAGSGGAMSGGDAVARMAAAYSDTAVDVVETHSDQAEPAEQLPRQVPDEVTASQPEPQAATPVTEPSAVDGTVQATPNESKSEPFRAFATETEYRDHIAAETRAETQRQRSAQAASDRELTTQRAEVERLKQEIQMHERSRNEIYARASKEQIEPETIVEVYQRREGETKAEFATRQQEAEVASSAEASRAERESLSSQAQSHATEKVLLEKALSLTEELGVIKGLDVKTALTKAIVESPDAQRFVAISYSGADEATRLWGQTEAYRIGMGIVRGQAEAVKAATAKIDAPVTPAVSIQAPATAGREVPRYRDSVEALSAAYGGTR